MIKKIVSLVLIVSMLITAPITLTGCKKYDYNLSLDVSYGSHERNKLDICLPERTGNVGLILMIHGGGWVAGNKDGYKEDLIKWSERGYVAASINYRYASTEIHIDDITADIELSLHKIKQLAVDSGINVDGMLLTGSSAGAHLSLYYAYAKADTSPIKPKAVVSFCGPTDLADMEFYAKDGDYEGCLMMGSYVSGYTLTGENFEEAMDSLKYASPINFVTENTVPTVICHGKKDYLVPFSNASNLKNKLDSCGVKNDFVVYKRSGHGLDKNKLSTLKANRLMKRYAEKYL